MPNTPVTRRTFLRQGTVALAATVLGKSLFAGTESPAPLRFGFLTDVHYADRDPAGKRFYRESLAKMREAVAEFTKAKCDFIIQNGDFVDAAPTAAEELGYLQTIQAEFNKFTGPRYHVLGNHDVWTLTKPEYLAAAGLKAGHYSFDHGGWHFVVLDACYRADGVEYGAKNFNWSDADVPVAQRDWLAADLAANAGKPVIGFIHQRTDLIKSQHAIKSHEAVRQVLEKAGNVRAIFQGHHHVNNHQQIAGIHYLSMMATVEGSGEANNAYAVVELTGDRAIQVTGHRQQKSYAL